ncbi:MAG: hypothetical protein JJ937_17125, partial [Parvibaculum sp.]|nr:hypothetical protein [Parvibaculum sp.]
FGRQVEDHFRREDAKPVEVDHIHIRLHARREDTAIVEAVEAGGVEKPSAQAAMPS